MTPFRSFWMAGFECAAQRLWPDRRLDLTAETQHDLLAAQDYERLGPLGIRTVRDGVRWHLIERVPEHYDFSSVEPILRASLATGTQVIWDLCHYDWPDYLDIFKPNFITAFARFASAFACWLGERSDEIPWFVPINEPSYLSWAAGEVGYFYPFATGRGDELKTQLVRATIASIDAIRQVQPKARFLHIDPLIHIDSHREATLEEQWTAREQHEAQYHAKEMLCGQKRPELAGRADYLDVVGVSFYPTNQWFWCQSKAGSSWQSISVLKQRGDADYVPLRLLLKEIHERFSRPLLVAETGTEGVERPEWFSHVAEEVRAAQREGVPVLGICWYPILNHAGWDDDRHCLHGLWDYAEANGTRPLYEPLFTTWLAQQEQ